MLYIPAEWSHWVFSYPDEQQNIAISYPVTDFGDKLIDLFSDKKPFKHFLDKNEHSFFNYTLDTYKKMYPHKKVSTIISTKNHLLYPKKHTMKNNKQERIDLTFKEMDYLLKNNTHNIYMGQNPTLKPQRPPQFIIEGFPNSRFNCNQWLALFKKDTEYIDSGLHYDITHGILIQIKGKKLVRLFRPEDVQNLYIQPMYITSKIERDIKN